MKKYGKYEKRPEPAAPKGPKAKNMLLQTYFASLLCLVLCVTMFLSTTFAWFTSEVTNAGNEIHIGILKVGLYKEDGTNLATSESNTKKLFDGSIRWEPGYTALETIQVVNEGDLAFKYVLSFTDGSVSSGELADVAASFEVWVFDHLDKEYTKPESYSAITQSKDWVKVGTLADVLNGTPVLENKNMVSVRQTEQESTVINEGTEDGLTTKDTYTIALHMMESTDSSVMGCKLNLNVKLIAYQMASELEKDDLGSAYDAVTPASDLKELTAALNAGENTVLLSDIQIDSEADTLQMSGGVLDGAGNTLSYSGDRNANGGSVGVLNVSGGTVSNLTIAGNDNGRALYVTQLASDLFVSNCTLSGAYSFNLNSSEVTGKTLTFVDTVFASWTSYANVMEHAYFTGCTFENTLRPYGDTTLTGCKFTGDQLDVSLLQEGETVTLIDCTYGDTVIEMAVLKVTGGTVTVEGSSELVITDGNLTVVVEQGVDVHADS